MPQFRDRTQEEAGTLELNGTQEVAGQQHPHREGIGIIVFTALPSPKGKTGSAPQYNKDPQARQHGGAIFSSSPSHHSARDAGNNIWLYCDFCVFAFWDRVSLCSHGIHPVDEINLQSEIRLPLPP